MSVRHAKDRIIEAAATLFTTHGVHKTTVAHVAEAAGVAKGSVYYHFQGKDDLLAATIEAGMDDIFHRVEAATAGSDDPRFVLRTFLSTSYRLMTEYRDLALFAVTGEYTGASPHSKDRIDKMRNRLHDFVVDTLQRGVQSGFFRVRRPDHAAHILLGALQGAVRAGKDAALGSEDELIDFVMQGVENQ